MKLGEVLALGPVCEVCQKPARQLYPLTRFARGRLRALKACLSCCGPTGLEPTAGLDRRRPLDFPGKRGTITR